MNEKKRTADKGNIQFVPFGDFCRDNQRSIIVICVVLVIAYGLKLFNIAFSHDTEAIISVPESLYSSWMTMGRFGLILIKRLCDFYVFNPYLASVFMFIAMLLGALVWEYLFYCLTGAKADFHKRSWIFPTLFFSAPVMAEQVSFLLQAFEVELAVLLTGVALLWVWKNIIDRRSLVCWLPAVLLLAVCFSCYQTLVPFFIAASIACFILCFDGIKKPWRVIGQLIACFAVSFGVYQIVCKLIMWSMNISMTSYISEQILWGQISVKECIKNILRHIRDVLTASNLYYSIAFSISVVMLLVVVLYRWRKRCSHVQLYMLASAALLLAPFYMTILLGQMPKYRTQIILPFVFGFIIQYFIGWLKGTNSTRNAKLKKISYVIGGVALLLGVHQSMYVSKMFYSEYVQYQEDVRLAVKITDRIDQLDLGETPEEPVVFIGSRSPRLNKSSSSAYENPGHSFFEWAFTTEYGTFIMKNFLETLGYNYQSPTPEQAEQAVEYSKKMASWPDTGSVIQKDGIIIVKLSDI